MKTIYTINSTLVAIKENGEKRILDKHSQEFAYKARENASKALERLKQVFIADCGYEATTDELLLIKRRSHEDTNLYELRYEIEEHYLSDYEKD